MALGKLLSFSVPQFPLLYLGDDDDDDCTCLRAVWKTDLICIKSLICSTEQVLCVWLHILLMTSFSNMFEICLIYPKFIFRATSSESFLFRCTASNFGSYHYMQFKM